MVHEEAGAKSRRELCKAIVWKKMPLEALRAGEEKPMLGFKALKDRLTLLVGLGLLVTLCDAKAHLPFRNCWGL